jgi:nucleoid-associated protein YgaU
MTTTTVALPMRGHLRLTIRGKVVVALMTVLLAFAAGKVAAFHLTAVPSSGGVVSVVVHPGDSLWSIAQRHAGPGTDVRAVVDAVRDLNGMTGSTLLAGDVVLVPTAR